MDKFHISKIPSTQFNYIGLTQQLSVNNKKKRLENKKKNCVTQYARIEKILGKAPEIFNGHQPPRTVYLFMAGIRI